MTEKRKRMSRPAPIGDLLKAAFEGKPAERRLKEGKIWMVWEGAVGGQIAANASPAAFRDGTLTVFVSNAPWMQQLGYMKNEIRSRLNTAIGEELVREIFFKAGRPEPLPVESRTEKPEPRPLTAEEETKIAEETAGIADPELRAAIASLLARHLGNQKP